MTKRNFKRMMVTLLAVMMFFTSVPSTALAASYPYNINGSQRNLEVTNGKTTLTVEGKSYDLTKALVSKDAGSSEDGTVWIEYKNLAIYWWNYDLQKDEDTITLHKYTTGASLNIEGDYVVSLNSTTGEKIELLSVEEQKKVLGISESTEPTQPEEKPTEPTPAPIQPEQKPSQTTPTPAPTQPEQKPSQTTPTPAPTQPEQKPSQTTPTPAPSQPTTQKPTTKKPSTKQPSQTTTKKKTTTVKAGKVIHKGCTYYVYNTKGKVMTKFSLTKKGGKFTWRNYTMRNVLYVAMIRKSKRIVVLTKNAGYKFDYSSMKRSKLYDTKKYGKPLKLEYDNDGFAIRVVTKKPRRFSIKNK